MLQPELRENHHHHYHRRSSTIIANKIGDSFVLWGMPPFNFNADDDEEANLTVCVLPSKNAAIQR